MKIFKIFSSIVTYLLLFFVLITVIFTFLSNSNNFSGYFSYLVQSGSMEPTIMTGDIILVSAEEDYFQNDVVTFTDSDSRIVTHRIVQTENVNGSVVYTTKGDANRTQDRGTIEKKQIIGKVQLVIPKVGYLLNFTKSLYGLIFLIIVPSILFVINELIKMTNAKQAN